MDTFHDHEVIPLAETALRELEVGVVETPEEVKRFEALLSAEHYLRAPATVGDQLRQVIRHGDRWVALLVWGPAAYALQERDAWIGWDRHTRAKRQKLVVQNRRFLVLAEARVPNLASAALGAAVRVLSEQWQGRFGYKPLLAETFTDPEQFAGTCYKAAGWTPLGLTAGFSRVRGPLYYQKHDRPKRLWLKPLVPAAAMQLRTNARAAASEPGEVAPPQGTLPVRARQLDRLLVALRQVPDPRTKRQIQLATVLALTSLALLAGAQTIAEIQRFATKLTAAQREAVLLPRKPGTKVRLIPSYSVFYGVLSRVDAQAFAAVLTQWLTAEADALPKSLALDGKAVRDRVMLVTLVDHTDGAPAAVALCPDKAQEMKTAQALIASLPAGTLAGALVTADALHCQQATAEQLVRDQGADYLLQIKANQPGLLARAVQATTGAKPFFV